MIYLKSLQKNHKGFISIVALGIFALMAVFGIIAQAVANSTVKSVKNTKQYYEARDIADSVTEYLQWELSSKKPGYNYDLIEDDEVECDFSIIDKFSDDVSSSNNTVDWNDEEVLKKILSSINDDVFPKNCRDLLIGEGENPSISNLNLAGKSVKIKKMKIQGTSNEDQDYSCTSMGMSNCYVTPIMGTGDAAAETDIDCNSLMTGDDQEELDHPCNWNVLKHGSSVTDRVTIPLFNQLYDKETEEDGDVFSQKNCEGSECNLLLRIRPSCKEKYEQLTGLSQANGDPCNDNRWTLENGDPSKAIVQWQITGKCVNKTVEGDDAESTEEVECGMINKIDVGGDEGESSLINVAVINGGIEEIVAALGVLYEGSTAQSTGGLGDIEHAKIEDILEQMKNPKLTLLLSSKLKANNIDIITQPDNESENVIQNPLYLEYQVLTSQPIASPKIKMDVEIDVDGTIFKKTLYKYEEKDLVDFAVQS